MPLPKLFLAFCKGIFIYVLLFQQIIIREVIDFHGLAHFGEGGGGGLFGHGAAFLQNFHDLGQALLPLLAAVAGSSSACMTLFRNFFTFTSPRPPR